jgi:hypothetical protein
VFGGFGTVGVRALQRHIGGEPTGKAVVLDPAG